LNNSKFVNIPKSTNAGIYMLYNLDTHRVYIGETQNFHSRALQHRYLLRSKSHSNVEMQQDYSNGCKFAFAILEDVGKSYSRDYLRSRERQYIYAFRRKYVAVYNHETTEQLRDLLFFDMVFPTIDNIQKDLRKSLGCYINQLCYCSQQTIVDKFSARR
jgi:hypothetical protein